MKKVFMILNMICVLSLTQVFGQEGKFSVGLVSSHFTDGSNGRNFSKIENPVGTGILAGYRINRDLALSVTTEYIGGDMENDAGKENIFRTNFSGFIFLGKVNFFNPYLSGGIVLDYCNRDYDQKNDINVSRLQNRIGLGIDIPIYQGLNLNLDFAMYSTELEYTGWAQSLGFRYTL